MHELNRESYFWSKAPSDWQENSSFSLYYENNCISFKSIIAYSAVTLKPTAHWTDKHLTLYFASQTAAWFKMWWLRNYGTCNHLLEDKNWRASSSSEQVSMVSIQCFSSMFSVVDSAGESFWCLLLVRDHERCKLCQITASSYWNRKDIIH